MYKTLEATVENGRVVPVEAGLLPKTGKALIILLNEPTIRPGKRVWKTVRKSLGWLKASVDAGTWQHDIRSAWECRS
jgi:hypothetical protein